MFGPVVAAAVILECGTRFRGLTDSKKLPEKKRIELDVEIRAKAVAWAIAAVDAETIDRINIRRASLLAMRLAVEQLAIIPDYLLIDGVDTIEWACPQQSVIQGDGTSFSIAAASVLAKVYRDGLSGGVRPAVSRIRISEPQRLLFAGTSRGIGATGAYAVAQEELEPRGAADA